MQTLTQILLGMATGWVLFGVLGALFAFNITRKTNAWKVRLPEKLGKDAIIFKVLYMIGLLVHGILKGPVMMAIPIAYATHPYTTLMAVDFKLHFVLFKMRSR